MNKFLAPILMASLLTSTSGLQAYDTSTLASYPKAAAAYLFSTNGVKDLAAAYGVMMLVTLIHELGHAAVAKLTCGAPVDIVIGGKRTGKDSLFKKYTGIELAGFNPLESSARWEEHYKEDKKIYNPTLGQDTAMLLAGPLAQAITGYCLYQWLKTKDNFYLAKAAAIGGIVDTVVGINGLYGAGYVPWSDASKIAGNIKKYFRGNNHESL